MKSPKASINTKVKNSISNAGNNSFSLSIGAYSLKKVNQSLVKNKRARVKDPIAEVKAKINNNQM